jgi:pyridinium-3,5-biscarboxylic acid mononucleotide synthase
LKMPSPAPLVLELLSQLARGESSVAAVAEQLESLGNRTDPRSEVAAVDGATVDLGRVVRCGFGEVVYGEGKSANLIASIIGRQLKADQRVLVTRISSETATQLVREFPMSRHNALARTLYVDTKKNRAPRPLDSDELASTPHVAVVTAGSTDAPVAEEAIETLSWMGVAYQRFEDIGVAGPQRLQMAVPRLRLASAVIVIAGMEGALPAAVAGHLAVPIIAVPTSIGYGANLGGLTTMLGMLSSCAASVAVVNIDAGFKGAYVAGMIVNQLQQTINKYQQPLEGKR